MRAGSDQVAADLVWAAAQPPEFWLQHALAQSESHVEILDEKIAEAQQKLAMIPTDWPGYGQGIDYAVLAGEKEPEPLTQEQQAHADAAFHREIETHNLQRRRDAAARDIGQLRRELRVSHISITRPVTSAPSTAARAVSRPRERHEQRTKRSCSSSGDDSSGLDSDSDPPGVAGPHNAARKWAAA